MRKRSKYRPKPIIRNPLNYVLGSIQPINQLTDVMLDLKIKNSQAMYALTHGTATRADMNTLVALSNMTEALHEMGFGEGREYQEMCIEGRVAIIAICHRAGKHKKFVPTGPEMNMLNQLMELHEAQLELCTVRDVEKALAHVNAKLLDRHKVIQLPKFDVA